MSASPFFTTPLLSLQRLGWIGLGDSRAFMLDALGGFYSLREQIAQEIGPEAEAEMVQRAGFASAERLIAAGRESGELDSTENGFHKALSLLALAGYGQFRATEVRFDQRWARVTADASIEGWMYRETATRPVPCCDFIRGMLAGIMYHLADAVSPEDLETAASEPRGFTPAREPGVSEVPNGVDISCIETGCIAAGEDECAFVLGPANMLAAEGLSATPMSHSSVRETLLRLNRQLEQILDSSRKDPLTKLYNRSFFESALRQKIGYAKRRSDVISLATIDIDFFKSINDTHLHTVGDRVLRQIARTLEQQARENDVVARLGGDEFVWLMPATPGEAALSVAQRLRRAVEDLAPSIGFNVTVSIGVANYPQDAATPAELMERSDAALFAAKRAGRDRALRYSPEAENGHSNGNGNRNGNGNGPHGVGPTAAGIEEPEIEIAPNPVTAIAEPPQTQPRILFADPPETAAGPPEAGSSVRVRTGVKSRRGGVAGATGTRPAAPAVDSAALSPNGSQPVAQFEEIGAGEPTEQPSPAPLARPRMKKVRY